MATGGSHMRILCFDLATRIGWAWAEDKAAPVHGVHRLPSTGDDLGRFLHAARQWIDGKITEVEPHLIVYESPILRMATQLATLRKLYSLASIAELVAIDRCVKVEEAALGKIRTNFLGAGNCPRESVAIKRAIVHRCRERGWHPQDDNDADALALLDYARAIKIDGWAHEIGLFANEVAA